MNIVNLKTNHLENPVGYEFGRLHISWNVVDSISTSDDWTRVFIREDNGDGTSGNTVYDSDRMDKFGKQYLDIDTVNDIRLKPRTRYNVSVEVKAETVANADAYFETGKMDEKWKASFISTENEEEAMPCFFKTVCIHKRVKRARLYCAGYGIYEAYLDGEKLGDEYLLPGYHSYDFINEYQTFDVTDALNQGDSIKGEHILSFIVGEGWYKGRFVFEGGFTNLYGDKRKMIAELHIEYDDGSKDLICTGEDFKAKDTNILFNNIYDGETIDFSYPETERKVVVLPDSTKLLRERSNPPIHQVEELKVREVIHTPAGETVLDFGETVTGWVEINRKCLEERNLSDTEDKHGHAGNESEICLTYGEIMQNGNFYRENLRTAKAEFVLKNVSRLNNSEAFSKYDQKDAFRPHFTYYGFRYVKVEGLKDVKGDEFVAKRLMSDIAISGALETGVENLNKFIGNSLRSQKCNFLDIPTDCPQRDERMGWSGDIAIYADTACFHMSSAAFLNHYLENLRLEQIYLDGSAPLYAPTPKPPQELVTNPFLRKPYGSCTWGDVATILPWNLYEHYNDAAMLKTHYPIMTDWADYVSRRVAKNRVPYLWQNDWQLGDWLSLDNDGDDLTGRTDSNMIATAYYYNTVVLCKKAAKILGLLEDEAKWSALAKNIKEAFANYYFDENGDIIGEHTQTGYALILAFGLYREDNKACLARGLKKYLDEYNGHLSTGFVGTSVLCQALTENGMAKEAYTLLLNEEYPGWLHEVELGATTVWERWNSLDEDGSVSSTGMNSLNHYAYGSVIGWLYRYGCGFRYTDEGELFIAPNPDKRLGFLRGKCETPFGELSIEWKYDEGGNLSYALNIPFGAKIKVMLPGQEERVLLSGVYTF